jgi:RNA polymerase sigma factor (sigma-70 family)
MTTGDDDLLDRWRAGDETAAEEIVRRHGQDLLTVVRRRLSSSIGRRLDADDVVQSALRSFFVAVRGGRFTAENGGDLWKLLSTITLNKLNKLVRFHSTEKRSMLREQSLETTSHTNPNELSPLEAIAFAEQLEQLLLLVPENRRPILELRLEGHDLDTIAQRVGCSQRTVRRVLADVKVQLQQAQPGDPP